MLVPGGGTLPDGRYELDSESPLADFKIGGRYVFEFDRNGTRTNEGVDVKKDYSCKEPGCPQFGKDFKTLPALGVHTKSAHKAGKPKPDEDDDEIVRIARPVLCKPCNRTFPNRAELMAHKREAHGQTGWTKKGAAETEPVPA
jgi:hypothetical protein